MSTPDWRANRFAISALFALPMVALWGYFWRTPSQHVFLFLCAEYLLLLPATIYALRSDGSATAVPLPEMPRRAFLAVFLALALAVSWIASHGQLMADEGAYLFQAKIFAMGHLTASAPPGSPERVEDTPIALFFQNHIISGGRWYAKYPWGWPFLLAGPARLGIPWVVNPLLGLLILLLMAAIAQPLFGRSAATLAVVIAILSPYFLAHSFGLMSHPACGAFLAAACLFCFKGLRTERVGPFLWMFLMIAAALQIRPYTAAAIGGVLGLGALWHLRGKDPFFKVLVSGLLFFVACAGLILLYNKSYTGSYGLSPYVLFRRIPYAQPGFRDIDFSLTQMINNVRHQTRWAVQETIFYTFPFAFLLAGYALWQEQEHPREVRILSAVAVVLVFAHVVQKDVATEFIGERYYFEGFFAISILAARGLQMLANKQGVAQRAVAPILVIFMLLQASQFAFAAPIFWERMQPTLRVRAAVEGLGNKRYTVFLQGTKEGFQAKCLILNRPDWDKGSLIFLIDPGAEYRNDWACRMSRPQWVVIGYDPDTLKLTEEFGSAEACPQGDPSTKPVREGTF